MDGEKGGPSLVGDAVVQAPGALGALGVGRADVDREHVDQEQPQERQGGRRLAGRAAAVAARAHRRRAHGPGRRAGGARRRRPTGRLLGFAWMKWLSRYHNFLRHRPCSTKVRGRGGSNSPPRRSHGHRSAHRRPDRMHTLELAVEVTHSPPRLPSRSKRLKSPPSATREKRREEGHRAGSGGGARTAAAPPMLPLPSRSSFCWTHRESVTSGTAGKTKNGASSLTTPPSSRRSSPASPLPAPSDQPPLTGEELPRRRLPFATVDHHT